MCVLNDLENCFDEVYDDENGFQLGKLGQLFDTLKENTEASLAKSKLTKSIRSAIDSSEIKDDIKSDVIIASLIEILSKSLAELELSPMDVIQTYMPRIMGKIAGCKIQQIK